MVREELGEDAVILSNKRIKDGVELLTTTDENEVQQQYAPQVDTSAQQKPFNNPFEVDDFEQPKPDLSAPPSKLELELERMQNQAKQRAAELAAAMAKRSDSGSELYDIAGIQSQPPAAEPQHYNEPAQSQKQPANVASLQPAISEQASELSEKLNSSQAFADIYNDQTETVQEKPKVSGSVIDAVDSFKRADAPSTDNGMSDMRFELEAMRELLENQLSSMAWGQLTKTNPHKASLWKRLKRMGINAKLADSLLDLVNERASAKEQWQQLMKILTRHIGQFDDDPIDQGGTFCFVGPAGAGKTTTIGKLATRYAMKHGSEGIALVSTDSYRVAAHEQLRTIGRILDVPVKLIDKNQSLERVLYSLRHKSLVLIDTGGLNRADARLKQQMREVGELGERAKTFMVLPATSQWQVIKSAYDTYNADNLTGCILTKLDEATSLGEILGLMLEKSVKVAYTSNGQSIPDDLQLADSRQLVRQAIEMAKHVVADDAMMSDELASLWLNRR